MPSRKRRHAPPSAKRNTSGGLKRRKKINERPQPENGRNECGRQSLFGEGPGAPRIGLLAEDRTLLRDSERRTGLVAIEPRVKQRRKSDAALERQRAAVDC